MDLEILILRKVKSETKPWYRLYVESKKAVQMNLQNRNRVTDVENKPTVTKGGRGGGAETGLAHALLRGAQSLGRVRLCGPIGLPASSSPASSSAHGIFQARALEWSAIALSRGSSWPRDGNHNSWVSCIGRRIPYYWATWQAHIHTLLHKLVK